MSKSKGNVINPLDLTDKYGTDAFRMGMVVGNTPGTSLALSEDKIRAYKNYANKLWNITRFVLSSTGDIKYDPNFNKYEQIDMNHISEWKSVLKDITSDMDNFRFYLAGEKLYHYSWHNFADKILEESKKIITEGTDTEKQSRKNMLLQILSELLICLHPFIPFVTEEIWSDMPIDNKKMLIIESWPKF